VQVTALVSMQAQELVRPAQAQQEAPELARRVEQEQSPSQAAVRRETQKWSFEFAFVNSLEARRALC
jgi:hypothetical protein